MKEELMGMQEKVPDKEQEKDIQTMNTKPHISKKHRLKGLTASIGENAERVIAPMVVQEFNLSKGEVGIPNKHYGFALQCNNKLSDGKCDLYQGDVGDRSLGISFECLKINPGYPSETGQSSQGLPRGGLPEYMDTEENYDDDVDVILTENTKSGETHPKTIESVQDERSEESYISCISGSVYYEVIGERSQDFGCDTVEGKQMYDTSSGEEFETHQKTTQTVADPHLELSYLFMIQRLVKDIDQLNSYCDKLFEDEIITEIEMEEITALENSRGRGHGVKKLLALLVRKDRGISILHDVFIDEHIDQAHIRKHAEEVLCYIRNVETPNLGIERRAIVALLEETDQKVLCRLQAFLVKNVTYSRWLMSTLRQFSILSAEDEHRIIKVKGLPERSAAFLARVMKSDGAVFPYLVAAAIENPLLWRDMTDECFHDGDEVTQKKEANLVGIKTELLMRKADEVYTPEMFLSDPAKLDKVDETLNRYEAKLKSYKEGCVSLETQFNSVRGLLQCWIDCYDRVFEKELYDIVVTPDIISQAGGEPVAMKVHIPEKCFLRALTYLLGEKWEKCVLREKSVDQEPDAIDYTRMTEPSSTAKDAKDAADEHLMPAALGPLKDPPGGELQVNLYREEEKRKRMIQDFPDRTYFTYSNFIAQSLGIPSYDPTALDQKLLQYFKTSAPIGDLSMIFPSMCSAKDARAVKSEMELPTLLHFAAYNGLSELCVKLMDMPGALFAYQMLNCDNDDPADLADRSNNPELGKYLRGYVVSPL